MNNNIHTIVRELESLNRRFSYGESLWYAGIFLLQAPFLIALAVSFRGDSLWIPADNAVFEYGGWIATKGYLPYLHLFDVKPPGIYLVSAGLAFLSGGDARLLHFFGALLTVATAIATTMLIAVIIREVTGDVAASLIGATVPLAVFYYWSLPPYGLRPKHFTALFALLAIWFALQERPAFAGASGAFAAAFWQGGAVVSLVVIGMLAYQSRRHAAIGIVAAFGVVVVTLLPFALREVLPHVISQAIIAHIFSNESETVLQQYSLISAELGSAKWVIPFGLVSSVELARRRMEAWWIPVVVSAALLFNLVFDYDSGADLILTAPLIGISVGVGVALVREEVPGLAGASAALVALLLIVPIAPMVADLLQSGPILTSWPDPPTIVQMLWHEQLPESCHIRMSYVEEEYIRNTAATEGDRVCTSVFD